MATDTKLRLIIRGEIILTDLTKAEQIRQELKRIFETYGGRAPEINILEDRTETR